MNTKRTLRFFNTTGPYNPEDHYMLPPEDRLVGAQLGRYIRDKLYWVLHVPQQTGKKLILMWLFYFLIGWIAYIGIRMLIAEIGGHSFDLQVVIIVGFITSFILPLFIFLPVSFTFLPRSKYLESADCSKPPFSVTNSTVIEIPQGYDFNRLKNDIAQRWELTFSDDSAKMLKVRTKSNFWSWGVGAWMKYESGTGKIQLACFWLAGMQDNRFSRKMQKEIEDFLQACNKIAR